MCLYRRPGCRTPPLVSGSVATGRDGPIEEELIADPCRLQGAFFQGGALVEQIQDLSPGHIADDGLVAKWQDVEHQPICQCVRVCSPDDVRAYASCVLKDHIGIIQGFRIIIELKVNRIVDEIGHQKVAIVVACQRHIGITDNLVDLGCVFRIAGPNVDLVYGIWILRCS